MNLNKINKINKMKNYLSIAFCTLILFLSSCSYMGLSEKGTLSIKQGNGDVTPVEYTSVNMGKCSKCTVGEITDRVNKIMLIYTDISVVPASCVFESLVIVSDSGGSGVAIQIKASRKNAFGVRLAPTRFMVFYDNKGIITDITENGKAIHIRY